MPDTLTFAVSMSKGITWAIYLALSVVLNIEARASGLVLLPLLLPAQEVHIVNT